MMVALLVILLIAGVVALYARSETLNRRIHLLEDRISFLEGTSSGARASSSPAPPPKPSAPLPAPAPRAPFTPPPPPPPMARPAPAKPSRSREEWEALVGGKLLNRIGALALIIGVALFLRHAFEQNWITETFRVLIGAAVGFTLLAVADRAHRKDFGVFAQGLVGAGIAVLYLSVYASFNYYSLVSQPVAFVLMSLVTVIAFTQAFRYDSLAVALIGWLGGFLTPFLLSTGEPNQIGLFTYVLILDAGLIPIARSKPRWFLLEPLALAGTWIIYFLWWAREYREAELWITLLYVLLFWGIFHALDIALAFRDVERPVLRRLIGWGNWFFSTIALWYLIEQTTPEQKGLAFLLFAVAYLCSSLAVMQRRGSGLAAFPHYAVAAAILLGAAIIAEFEDFWIPIFLGLEAVSCVIAGHRIREQVIQRAGEVIVAAVIIGLLATRGAFAYTPLSEYTPIWNERALAFIVLAIAFAVAGWYRRKTGNGSLVSFATYGSIMTLVLLATVEISDIFLARAAGGTELETSLIHFHRLLSLSLAWGCAGFFLLLMARGNWRKEYAGAGIWILLLGTAIGAARGIVYSPVELFLPVANFRCVTLLLLGAAMLFAVPILRDLRSRLAWIGRFIPVFRIVAAMTFFMLLTGEILDTFGKTLAEVGVTKEEWVEDRIQIENLKQLSLSGGWLLFSIGLMAVGLIRRLRNLRVMAIFLFALTTLKVFFFDLSFLELSYRFISAIALGIILLAVSYLYRRYREIITEPTVD